MNDFDENTDIDFGYVYSRVVEYAWRTRHEKLTKLATDSMLMGIADAAIEAVYGDRLIVEKEKKA